MNVTTLERDLVIEALDQFIANTEELFEAGEQESPQLVTARDLLERMQSQKLRELGV